VLSDRSPEPIEDFFAPDVSKAAGHVGQGRSGRDQFCECGRDPVPAIRLHAKAAYLRRSGEAGKELDERIGLESAREIEAHEWQLERECAEKIEKLSMRHCDRNS
jgi:hypothetical protein